MRTLMLQGTSSHAGKSLLTAAILRILANRGVRCAPFKPQNMALNSAVTPEGCEIGRAQAMQAEAARVAATRHMNPILLKPSGGHRAQVMLQGQVWKTLTAREYTTSKRLLRRYVRESFESLAGEYDVIVCEGAGSPAEINLRANDLANMGFARMYDIPVLLVGDIDRGGVYASFYGTYALLTAAERRLLKGFVVNKFRGDASLLGDAHDYIMKRTGRPVAGVVPMIEGLAIADEDSVALDRGDWRKRHAEHRPGDRLVISIVRLPHTANFTDFDPLFHESGISVTYVTSPDQIAGSHLVIIPGSKNTVDDLLLLRQQGFTRAITAFHRDGGVVLGICGGYQMLCRDILDPDCIESTSCKRLKGLGLLPGATVFRPSKQLRAVQFSSVNGRLKDMTGYEIHMGDTDRRGGAALFTVCYGGESWLDGLVSDDGRVLGTYLHGLFENDGLRLDLLNRVRRAHGMKPVRTTYDYRKLKDDSYERLAEVVERSIDMELIEHLLRL